MAALSNDQLAQALIIGWGFSSTIQGVTGFGVPVAVSAPLLVMLGVPPIRAAAMSLVGHGWAVTFGSLGSSYYTLQLGHGHRRGGDRAAHGAALPARDHRQRGARRAHPGRPASGVAQPAAGHRRWGHHGRRDVRARAGWRATGRVAGRGHAGDGRAGGPDAHAAARGRAEVRHADATRRRSRRQGDDAPGAGLHALLRADCPQLWGAGGAREGGRQRPASRPRLPRLHDGAGVRGRPGQRLRRHSTARTPRAAHPHRDGGERGGVRAHQAMAPRARFGRGESSPTASAAPRR